MPTKSFLGFVFDEDDMLKASCSFSEDKKRLFSTSGSNDQIHFMMPRFCSVIDLSRAVFNTLSFKLLVFTGR